MSSSNRKGGGSATVSGLTPNQILVGKADGTIHQTADLTYDDTTNDFKVAASESGGTVQDTTENTSNTASSDARKLIQVAGSSGGNPYTTHSISGGQAYSQGIDNAGSGDPYVFGTGANLSTPAWSVNSSGELAVYPISTLRTPVVSVVGTVQSDVGNVGAGNDNLHLISIPANTLGADGESLDIETGVLFAGNGNNKRVRIYYGNDVLFDSGVLTQSGGALTARARVVRTGASTNRSHGMGACNTFIAGQVSNGVTNTAALASIVVTGEGVADNDIIARLTIVRWNPANN